MNIPRNLPYTTHDIIYKQIEKYEFNLHINYIQYLRAFFEAGLHISKLTVTLLPDPSFENTTTRQEALLHRAMVKVWRSWAWEMDVKICQPFGERWWIMKICLFVWISKINEEHYSHLFTSQLLNVVFLLVSDINTADILLGAVGRRCRRENFWGVWD